MGNVIPSRRNQVSEQVHPVHLKQVQTYLKLSGRRLGYLLNFGAPVMKTGVRRCVNRLPD